MLITWSGKPGEGQMQASIVEKRRTKSMKLVGAGGRSYMAELRKGLRHRLTDPGRKPARVDCGHHLSRPDHHVRGIEIVLRRPVGGDRA